MSRMGVMKKRYRDLEMKVMSELRSKIEVDGEVAVGHCDYGSNLRLIIVGGRHVLVDSEGHHRDALIALSLEELIDILAAG